MPIPIMEMDGGSENSFAKTLLRERFGKKFSSLCYKRIWETSTAFQIALKKAGSHKQPYPFSQQCQFPKLE